MRGRRRRLAGGLAATVAISAFLVVPGAGPAAPTVVDGVDFGVIEPGPNDVLVGPTPPDTTLQVTLTTSAAVQVGAPAPRFTG
jgi:hypothetical protein